MVTKAKPKRGVIELDPITLEALRERKEVTGVPISTQVRQMVRLNYQYSLTGPQQAAIQTFLRELPADFQKRPEWELLHSLTYADRTDFPGATKSQIKEVRRQIRTRKH